MAAREGAETRERRDENGEAEYLRLLGERIRIRTDHVIEEMVALLGGHVVHVQAAFDPETGAYAGGHSHHGLNHDHSHHDHSHDE